MHEVGHRLGERLVGCPGAGVFGVLLFQRGNFLLGQEREELQVADDVAVVSANPKLVELIDAGPARIEPHRAGLGLAELACRRHW